MSRPRRPAATVIRTSLRAHLTGCGWFWVWAILSAARQRSARFRSAGCRSRQLRSPQHGWRPAQPFTARRSDCSARRGSSPDFVAWVQRAGPGTTCWQTATASGCDQHLNLWVWGSEIRFASKSGCSACGGQNSVPPYPWARSPERGASTRSVLIYRRRFQRRLGSPAPAIRAP